MTWWENAFLKIKDNRLSLGERDATEIAKEYGTPIFVYSREQIRGNLQNLKEAFSCHTTLQLRVCYAVKANPNSQILTLLRDEGAWVDAVSPGEVEAAFHAGFPAEKILFTGTSLSDEDLKRVFSLEGITINIDALEQLEIMKKVRKSSGNKKIRVSVRWNPGIGKGFNPKVVTAGKKAPDGTPVKFGVEEKKVNEAVKKAKEYGFEVVGLHQHLGSGWVKEDFDSVVAAVDKMIDKAKKLEKKGISLEFLDFGGGFGPRYTKNQRPFPLQKYIQHICQRIRDAGLKIKALAIEPGKYLVADAGVLLLRVEYVKESYGNTFVCVNCGTYNSVPRPAIYSQACHEIVNCRAVEGKKRRRLTVAGNLCETGDVFGKEILMPLPKRGDILAVLNAGAYCRSMASNFNLREIPPEIIL